MQERSAREDAEKDRKDREERKRRCRYSREIVCLSKDTDISHATRESGVGEIVSSFVDCLHKHSVSNGV